MYLINYISNWSKLKGDASLNQPQKNNIVYFTAYCVFFLFELIPLTKITYKKKIKKIEKYSTLFYRINSQINMTREFHIHKFNSTIRSAVVNFILNENKLYFHPTK